MLFPKVLFLLLHQVVICHTVTFSLSVTQCHVHMQEHLETTAGPQVHFLDDKSSFLGDFHSKGLAGHVLTSRGAQVQEPGG